MSANDFLAQSTPQSIGATSIPSLESFESLSLTSSKTLIQTTGSISRETFPSNSRIAKVVFLYPDQIDSGESIPTTTQLNILNSRTYFEFLSSINSSESFPALTVNSISSISPDGIGSTESFADNTINFLSNISIGTGITSSENLRPNNILKHIGRIFFPNPIYTGQVFSNPSIYLSRTIYPNGIGSSEFITNNHLFNGIQQTIRFIQQYSINSVEELPSNALLSPPTPAILNVGFIKSWVAVVNNVVVRVSKKNILDVDTIIEYQRYIQSQNSHTINSDFTSNKIESSQQSKYNLISYIDVEKIDFARQSTQYLENYIKQKHYIESYLVAENITRPKVTRYKIDRY